MTFDFQVHGVRWFLLLGGLMAVVTPRSLLAQGSFKGEHAEREATAQVLFRERALDVTLQQARDRLDQGRRADALSLLQRIFDGGYDVFTWQNEDEAPKSLRAEAYQLLNNADRATIELYEQIYGPVARSLLSQAIQAGDHDEVSQVARRFLYTSAGFRAADLIASRELDAGRYQMAFAWWDELFRIPVHRPRFSAVTAAKAFVAAERSGNLSGAEEFRDLARESGRTETLSTPSISANSVLADWLIPQGSPTRNGITQGSVPLLHPTWTRPFASRLNGQEDEELRTAIEFWENKQYMAGQLQASASHPIGLDKMVVFRDVRAIRACNAADGSLLWSYPCVNSLAREYDAGRKRGRRSEQIDLNRPLLGNSVLGTLSSDGQRIYFVDAVDFEIPRRGARIDRLLDNGMKVSQESNRLIALEVSSTDAPTVAWEMGGADEENPLANHFFFGPPLPVDSTLYAITENDTQLNLVALDAATGGLKWIQGIAFATQPVNLDRARFTTTCVPTFGGGVILCPTELGTLVAVHPHTGQLLWTYLYSDREASFRLLQHGEAAVPNFPMIVGDSAVYLPRQSTYLHCLDLKSGTVRWKIPREGSDYIGVIQSDLVLLVGRRECRAVHLSDGELAWSKVIGAPAGRGICVEDRYLLPLEEGIVLDLDIRTGKERGFAIPFGDHQLGHLMVRGDQVVSVGAREVVAFPSAKAQLDMLLQPTRLDPADQLLAGELELRLGRIPSARQHLMSALANTLSDVARERGEKLMRELLYLILADSPDDVLGVLAELDAISQDPKHRGRFLIQRGEVEWKQGQTDAVLATIQEFTEQEASPPVPLLSDPACVVSGSIWMRDLLSRLEKSSSEKSRLNLEQRIATAQSAVLASPDRVSLEQFLQAYENWPQAAEIRQLLAQQLILEADFQGAELLLLQNRSVDSLGLRAEATRDLMFLWEQLGFYEEAGELLEELETTFADVRLSSGKSGIEVRESLDPESLVWRAWRQRKPLEWEVARVRIEAHAEPNELLKKNYRGYSRRLTSASLAAFDLIDKGRTLPDGRTETGRLVQIDRESGMSTATIDVPANYWPAPFSRTAPLMHLLPIAGRTSLLGVSMAERAVAWETTPIGMRGRPELIRVGSFGPDFCTFQTQQALCVLDPRTGAILWQRDGFERRDGLFSDPQNGLFGDEEAIVLFSADRSSYQVFSTRHGNVVRAGSLEDLRQYRSTFGRMLAYVSGTPVPTLKLWDPLTDEVLFEASTAGLLISPMAFSDELVLFHSSGRVRILNGHSGDVLLDATIPAQLAANVTFVRAFSDRDRYYLNLQKTGATQRRQRIRYYANDAVIPKLDLNGDLIAVDRKTGVATWLDNLQTQTVVHMPEFRLPFLVLLSRTRAIVNGRARSNPALEVRVLNSQNGETLGEKDNILNDRILQMVYEREAGTLEFSGMNTLIRLHFGPDGLDKLRTFEPIGARISR